MASTEGERSILRGLLAGAAWTAGRAAGHAGLRSERCPFYHGARETEPHIPWDCPRWDSARQAWMPWVLQEARALPALALPAALPVCLRAMDLLPLTLVRGQGRPGGAVAVPALRYVPRSAFSPLCGGGGSTAGRGRGLHGVWPSAGRKAP